jgi:NAD(P)-dependent dehydrogenase (short-subunit alcohol dehydrogenase family)
VVDFKKQVVVVTGAGRGMGRLFALDFAKRGASVVVNDLGGAFGGGGADTSVAQAVVDEIKAAGGAAIASGESVATPEGGAAIIETAVSAFGRVDAVVSNAGIVGNIPFEDMTHQLWTDMLAVHVNGAFNVSQPAYRVMKKQGYGRFVFMGSSAGMFGVGGQAHYAAAKAGIFGLKNVIAIEGAAHGILANYVMPWGTTRMITEAHAHQAKMLEMPLFKLMQPDRVTPMVVYLASRECSVSYQNYSAGAGRYARLFAGLGPGWFAGDDMASADDIAAHFAEISATDPYYVASSVVDESIELCRRHGIEFSVPGG